MNIEDMPEEIVMDLLGQLGEARDILRRVGRDLIGTHAWALGQGRVHLDCLACDAARDIQALYDLLRAYGAGDGDHALRVAGAHWRETT